MAKTYSKEQAIELITKKRTKVYEVRNAKMGDADTQRLCVNELSRLNKLAKRVNEVDDDYRFDVKLKPDIFEFSI